MLQCVSLGLIEVKEWYAMSKVRRTHVPLSGDICMGRHIDAFCMQWSTRCPEGRMGRTTRGARCRQAVPSEQAARHAWPGLQGHGVLFPPPQSQLRGSPATESWAPYLLAHRTLFYQPDTWSVVFISVFHCTGAWRRLRSIIPAMFGRVDAMGVRFC